MTYLQFIMEKADLSQACLARWLGLNQGRLSAIVNRKVRPTLAEQRKLERAFKNLPIRLLLEDLDDTRTTKVA
jgi:ribosome-binding protein aMBF1 (putative translation factor)